MQKTDRGATDGRAMAAADSGAERVDAGQPPTVLEYIPTDKIVSSIGVDQKTPADSLVQADASDVAGLRAEAESGEVEMGRVPRSSPTLHGLKVNLWDEPSVDGVSVVSSNLAPFGTAQYATSQVEPVTGSAASNPQATPGGVVERHNEQVERPDEETTNITNGNQSSIGPVDSASDGWVASANEREEGECSNLPKAAICALGIPSQEGKTNSFRNADYHAELHSIDVLSRPNDNRATRAGGDHQHSVGMDESSKAPGFVDEMLPSNVDDKSSNGPHSMDLSSSYIKKVESISQVPKGIQIAFPIP
jgi:hypothetical protein